MEDDVQHDPYTLSSEANKTGNKQYDQLCTLRDGYAFWGITALPNASCRKPARMSVKKVVKATMDPQWTLSDIWTAS